MLPPFHLGLVARLIVRGAALIAVGVLAAFHLRFMTGLIVLTSITALRLCHFLNTPWVVLHFLAASIRVAKGTVALRSESLA